MLTQLHSTGCHPKVLGFPTREKVFVMLLRKVANALSPVI